MHIGTDACTLSDQGAELKEGWLGHTAVNNPTQICEGGGADFGIEMEMHIYMLHVHLLQKHGTG